MVGRHRFNSILLFEESHLTNLSTSLCFIYNFALSTSSVHKIIHTSIYIYVQSISLPFLNDFDFNNWNSRTIACFHGINVRINIKYNSCFLKPKGWMVSSAIQVRKGTRWSPVSFNIRELRVKYFPIWGILAILTKKNIMTILVLIIYIASYFINLKKCIY